MIRPSRGARPPSTRARGRLLLAVVAAGLLGLLGPTARPTVAATLQLTVVSSARYDVQPEAHKVHVTVDARATSHTTDDAIHAYYFTGFPLQVPPQTAAYAATVGGKAVGVSVAKRTADYVLLAVSFGQDLGSGKSLRVRLQFDMVDPGGKADRALRISPSLISFQAWAFGTAGTAGSSVTVAFPPGYEATAKVAGFQGPTTDGTGAVTYTSGAIGDPATFYGDFAADKPGAFTQSSVAVGDLTVDVQAWADDPAWGRQVADLVGRGMPVLTRLIGLGQPDFQRLVVVESVSRSLGGYSGLFDPATGRIQVAYYAAPFVILHEATHAWFNSRLATDRWIDEAFASYYAQQAAAGLDLTVDPPRLTPALDHARVALNDWGAVGREDRATEDYAYAATLQLASLVGARATDAGLTKVWTSIAGGLAAYQPVHAAPTQRSDQGPPDWRGLLDQLEERTGASFTDLWRTWVVSTDQVSLLDERDAARADYKTTLAAAGAWELPRPIRDALGAWQFTDATRLMADARDVLARRDAIAARAAADGLTAPGTLRTVFEQATGSLASAAGEARDEAVTLDAIEAATAAARPDRGLLGQVGLLGAAPADDLAAARSAFRSGELASASARADLARTAWEDAEITGRGRVLAAGAVLVLLLVGLLVVLLRRGRRRRVVAAGPYATLDDGPALGDARTARPSSGPTGAERGEDRP